MTKIPLQKEITIMNDQNKRKKTFSFNIVDVALIVVAFIAVATLIFFFSQKDVVNTDKGDSVTLEYTLVFSPLREDFRNLVDVGSTITDALSAKELGEVVDITYSEYNYIGTDKATGSSVSTVYPGMLTMTVTVRADAVKTGSEYVINGTEIVIGKSINVRVPEFTGTGLCGSVTEIDN